MLETVYIQIINHCSEPYYYTELVIRDVYFFSQFIRQKIICEVISSDTKQVLQTCTDKQLGLAVVIVSPGPTLCQLWLRQIDY